MERGENNVIGLRIGNPNRNSQQYLLMRSMLQSVERVCAMADECGYNLEHRNGQRTFGPPKDWEGPEPSKDCEIFVGHIPKGVFEDTLIPVFARCGKIYTFRLMMDFGADNRGFAFVTYTNHFEARSASLSLNHVEILPRKFLAVVKAIDNNSINLYGVPRFTNIKEILDAYVKGIKDQHFHCNGEDFITVTVTFCSHRDAALARRFLIQAATDIFMAPHMIMVDWTTRPPLTYLPTSPRRHNTISQHTPPRRAFMGPVRPIRPPGC